MLAQAADSGVVRAADGSGSSSLSSRSSLFKSPLASSASSTAAGAGSISKLAQAADSGVSQAADSGRSGSLSSRSGPS